MRILSCQNLSMRYDESLVVENVSFQVCSKDYLCIVGENGSGKTTLMKGILGLLKTMDGRVLFHGMKRTEIGYLPQQTMVQKDFPANVFEVVLSGCLNRHGFFSFYTKKDRERAYQNMGRLGIGSLRKKSYRELSGGQQQRVLLARAMCASDKLLMLDEPVTGLDPTGASEMYALLQSLNQDMGVTIVMISHDVGNSVQYGNKILHMQTSPLFYGSTKEYVKTAVGIKMLGGDCDD